MHGIGRIRPLRSEEVQKRPEDCRHGRKSWQMNRGASFPEHVTRKLLDWLLKHQNNPYPSAGQKQELAQDTGLSVLQVRNWFNNARCRGIGQRQQTNMRTNPTTAISAPAPILKAPSATCAIRASKSLEITPPCSLTCPAIPGVAPDLECWWCLCLFHYACVGVKDRRGLVTPVFCKGCLCQLTNNPSAHTIPTKTETIVPNNTSTAAVRASCYRNMLPKLPKPRRC